MTWQLFESLKEKSEDINYEILFTTLIFIVIGLIYFIYRLKRTFREENFENNFNDNNNNVNSNINNINSNNNNSNNSRKYEITIQIEKDRYNFEVDLNQSISQFVREKIYPLTNNKEVYLFYQGQILDQSKQFVFYEHRLSNGIVIICKIRQNVSRVNLNNRHYNDNMDSRIQEQLRNDSQSISIYTIITHTIIIIILGIIIFSYKTFKEIFTAQTLRTVKLLAIFWALCFSNSVTKLFYYRKIAY